MIITLDGPTASGKSTIARLIAEQLDYVYINSGLLFRAVAYVLIRKEALEGVINLKEHDIAALFNAGGISYHYESEPAIFYGPENITRFLKTPEIDTYASEIGTYAGVRQALLEYQRSLANDYDIVADGRDCGTVVFPDAEYKYFVTASLEVRAERWLHGKRDISLDGAMAIIQERDTRDSQRTLAPLRPADDGYIIDTSHMTVEEVVDAIMDMVGSA